MQVNTSTYHYIPLHTITYHYIPEHTSMYQNIQVHTKLSTYKYVPVHTGTYLYILVCTWNNLNIQVYCLILPPTAMLPVTLQQGISVSLSTVHTCIFQYIPVDTSSYLHTLIHTSMYSTYWYTLVCVCISQYIPLHCSTFQYILVFIWMYQHRIEILQAHTYQQIPVHTSIDTYTLVCTDQ